MISRATILTLLCTSVAVPSARADNEQSTMSKAAWSSAGGAVALSAIGAVLTLSARSRQDDLENLLSFRDSRGLPIRFDAETAGRYRDLVREGDRLELSAAVAFVGAGALAATAVTLFLLDDDDEPTAQLMPTVDQNSVGMAAAWGF